MKLSRNKAFTLVELIIVIAVIGVLAAILIPVFSNVIKKANAKSALADARNAVSMYVTESLDKRVHGDTSSPENITIIVEKGSRYYAFGYNTAESSSILVSNANEDGMSASDLDALINDHSFNVQNGGTYDPDTTYTLSDGAFYLVPYTGTTPDNTNVRGFVSAESASGNFLRLDEEAAGYGFDLNVGDTTAVFHGCLVKGTYDTVSVTTSNNDNDDNNGGGETTTTVTVNAGNLPSSEYSAFKAKYGSQEIAFDSEGNATFTDVADTTPVASFSIIKIGTSDYASYNFDYSTGTVADHNTLTASWTAPTYYSLTFNKGEGSALELAEAYKPAGWTNNGDTLLSGTNIADFVKHSRATAPTGKTFLGWTLNGGETVYNEGSSTIPFTANSVFTAEFGTQQVTVTYKAGTGATGSDKTFTVNYGDGTVKAFTDMDGWTLNSGKQFFRWNDGNNNYAAGAAYTYASDVTFTAQYSDLYTISFNANGGTGSMQGESNFVGGNTYNLPANGFTAPAHKHFAGWKANNSGETLAANTAYVVNANVTFYAQWENDPSYTVTYNKNTEDTVTGMPSNDTGVYAGTHTLSTATPTRTGYDFMGWATSSGSTTTVSQITVSGNTTVYAVWQINSYTVTFTDGTNSQNKSYNYNTTITLADENPLTAPSGKVLDKFTVGGADATTLTVTATTTVTVVWKNQAAATNTFTLNLKYWNRKGTSVQQTTNWEIDLAVGSTINFDITDLKQAGVYRTYDSGGLGVYNNFISVTKSATIDTSTGTISSGSAVYTFSYTRVAADGSSHDIDIYCVGCAYPPATDPAEYSGTHHGSAIPDLPTVDTYASASVINADYNTRSIPGVTNPTVIYNAVQLAAIGGSEQAMTGNYILDDDMALSGNWTPLGHGLGQNGEDVEFTGTLDGAECVISGLEIAMGDPIVDPNTQETSYNQNVGFFAMLGSGSIVQDLIIQTTANGVDGGMVVGIVAGQNAGTIDNVVVTGPVNTEDPTSVDPAYVVARAADYYSYVGGLVGYNEGLIENCTVEGVVVYGYVEAGGAVGENVGEIYNTDVILNGVNTQIDEQTITSMGMNYIGGFVGLNDSGYIHDCTVAFTDSAIVKGNNYIGGFCGENTRNSTTENSAKLLNCEASGAEVYGRQYVGGFCGYNQSMSASYKAEIVNCDISVFDIDTAYYSEATILANLAYVGGFVGCNNGDISQSSADFIIITNTHVSYVVGYQRVGGFAGRNDSLGNIATSACTDAYVVGYMFAGGFCAENYGTITESFANNKGLNSLFTDNDILSTYPTYIGGLIGANRGTVTSCYAITENIIKGYNYVGGLMGAHYSNAQSTGYVANCFSDCLVYGATKDISIAYVSNATVIGLYHVSNQTTSNYSTRVSYNAITSSSFASICNWNTQLSTLWSFTDGDYPNLVNNPR